MSRSLTSHSTLYKSFRGRFLQVRWPNQQRQSTEGSQFATEISLNPTRTTPPCYNINFRQPPLGCVQHKGPGVTKTQSAGPLSCLEHRATRVLHSTIVTRAAVLMFPLYFRWTLGLDIQTGPRHNEDVQAHVKWSTLLFLLFLLYVCLSCTACMIL